MCRYDLLGISMKESTFNCNAENTKTSREKSYGCYQIRLDMPSRKHIEIAEAKDYRWASAWTIDRIVNNGYPKYRTAAIQCHNGCGVNNGYAAKVKYWSDSFETIYP